MVSVAKLASAGKLTAPMKIALAEAGVSVKTLTERTWLWLAEHPGSSVNACADSLKEPRSNVSSSMSMLWRRDMVSFTEAYLDRTRPQWKTRLYTCKGKSYEMKPLIRESSRPTAKTRAKKEQAVTLPSAPEPVPLDARMESLVETLSIKEARALYEKLKALLLC